jgi:hypothetical protein
MMKRLFLISILAAVCCGCFVSCNEKPTHYRFVKVLNDGKEEVEQLDAKDDTAALNIYMKRMEEILVESIEKQEESPYKSMFIISPDGDTLNTNEELLNEEMKTSNPVPAPAASAEPVALKPVGDAKQEPAK